MQQRCTEIVGINLVVSKGIYRGERGWDGFLPTPSDPAASGLPPPLPLLQSSLLLPFVDMSETTGTVINKPAGRYDDEIRRNDETSEYVHGVIRESSYRR